MRIPLTHSTAILFAFLLAASIAVLARPTAQFARAKPPIDLKTMIPRQIGEWRMDTNMVPLVASESAERTLKRIYNQTLSRTYVAPNGNRIMLALAYGSEQNDELKAHRPEICYPAQGFELLKQMTGVLNAAGNTIPITRIVAVKGSRIEPVTYWLAIGDHAAATELQRKFFQLRYGLTGTIPDGMLVRVSSIDRDYSHAFAQQDEFIRLLIASVAPQHLASLGLHVVRTTIPSVSTQQ